MEYKVVSLKAYVATGVVFESHWTLTHTVGLNTSSRYGSVGIPSNPTALQFATVTEQQAIDATKAVLGPEFIAALEAGVLAEIAEWQTPTVIQGVPWAPPPPPPAPAPAPAPPPP
jgi:hypothetical protein